MAWGLVHDLDLRMCHTYDVIAYWYNVSFMWITSESSTDQIWAIYVIWISPGAECVTYDYRM